MATFPILRVEPTMLPRRRSRPNQTSLTLFPTAARHGDSESPGSASAPTPVPDRRTKPATELVGIARLAASSPCADAKRGTEYFLLPVRSILNHCDSERVPFAWTVNPYRGCEFGCKYCYARYTHEYMELDGGDFESKIYVKQNAGPLAERDLASEKIWGEHIAIGTATDPYQPAEKEFGATRAILEKMAEREGLSLSITTKSNQVVRDIDVIKRISERSSITIHMTVTTLRTRLARMLEPRAPRPDLRLAALAATARRWNQCRRERNACVAGVDRPRRRPRCVGARRPRCRRAVDCGQRAVPDAVIAETIPAVHRREISKASQALSRMVPTQRLRARGVSQGNFRTLRTVAPKIRSQFASGALQRKQTMAFAAAGPGIVSIISRLGYRARA